MKPLLLAASLIATLRFPRTNTLEAQKAEITRLTGELAAANEAKTKAESDLATERSAHQSTSASLAVVTSERDQARTDLTSANGTIATKDGEIANLKAAAVTVERKAQQLLASQGHEPLALTPDANTVDGKANATLAQQLDAITDPAARAKFYAKNKSKL